MGHRQDCVVSLGVRGWIAAGIATGQQIRQLYRLEGFNVQRELLGQEGLHVSFCV